MAGWWNGDSLGQDLDSWWLCFHLWGRLFIKIVTPICPILNALLQCDFAKKRWNLVSLSLNLNRDSPVTVSDPKSAVQIMLGDFLALRGLWLLFISSWKPTAMCKRPGYSVEDATWKERSPGRQEPRCPSWQPAPAGRQLGSPNLSALADSPSGAEMRCFNQLLPKFLTYRIRSNTMDIDLYH